MSNTIWPKIHHHELEKELGVKQVHFINDFVAIGYGVLNTPASSFIPLTDAPIQEGKPKALIGAGRFIFKIRHWTWRRLFNSWRE